MSLWVKDDNMTKCFQCNKHFEINDKYNEYYVHTDCIYQQDINHDYIISSHIKKIYLEEDTPELDLSQTMLDELHATKYYRLDNDAFNTVKKLVINNTLVDFTKFINLEILQLAHAICDVDLSVCCNLMNVKLSHIQYDVNLSNCKKLKTLELNNIINNVNLKDCDNLEQLIFYNSSCLLDLSDCTNLKYIYLENSEFKIIPEILHIKQLNIIDNQTEIDMMRFPFLISLNISNNNKLYEIFNIDKLELLQTFIYTDVMNTTMIHNFNFTNNKSLVNINIYSAKNKCNVIFSNNKLQNLQLNFVSDNQIYLPMAVNTKYNRINIQKWTSL